MNYRVVHNNFSALQGGPNVFFQFYGDTILILGFLSRKATHYPKYGKISQSIAAYCGPSDEGIMWILSDKISMSATVLH